MSRESQRLARDWLLAVAGVILFVSLFMTWSHEFPAGVEALPGMRLALEGVPRDATAWQVYSVADVLLALLAGALVGSAALRRGRVALLALAALALAFVAHAVAVAPTNGVDVLIPGQTRYLRSLAGPGVGETVAIVALVMALAGCVLGARPDTR